MPIQGQVPIQIVAPDEDQSLQFTLRANMNNSLINEAGRASQQVDMLSQHAVGNRPPFAASLIQPVMNEDSPPNSHRVFSPLNMKDGMYM